MVDRDACIGCGLCETACPNHVIGIFPKKQKVFDRCSNYNRGKAVMDVCKAGCIGCTKCSKVCPEGAITMDHCLAQVNPMKCTGCGTCVENCPTGCMSFTEKLYAATSAVNQKEGYPSGHASFFRLYAGTPPLLMQRGRFMYRKKLRPGCGYRCGRRCRPWPSPAG